MLITPDYVKEQVRLHEDPAYGAGSHRHAHLVAGIAVLGDCWSILDYGCGKGTLGKALRDASFEVDHGPGLQFCFSIREYDPAMPGKDNRPVPADLVTCIDVIEHIEPECLDDVIADLAALTRKRLFVDVATKFDKHRWLSDGRNSHQIVEAGDWWDERFSRHGFKVLQTWNTGVKAWVALMDPPK